MSFLMFLLILRGLTLNRIEHKFENDESNKDSVTSMFHAILLSMVADKAAFKTLITFSG